MERNPAAAPAGSESETDVHRLLLDAAPASELDWSDFDHVARDRDHVERVIKGAPESDAPGEGPDLDAGARAPRHRGPG